MVVAYFWLYLGAGIQGFDFRFVIIIITTRLVLLSPHPTPSRQGEGTAMLRPNCFLFQIFQWEKGMYVRQINSPSLRHTRVSFLDQLILPLKGLASPSRPLGEAELLPPPPSLRPECCSSVGGC